MEILLINILSVIGVFILTVALLTFIHYLKEKDNDDSDPT